MSDITLKWFFQIPGLFITIGVLLILIALLVLIIGSSKAKNKKQEDLSLVDDEIEPTANQVEGVNVFQPSGVNYLNGNNNLNSMNNLNNNLGNTGLVDNTNNISSVAPVVVNGNVADLVGNNTNITPMVNNPSNVITPVDINNGSMMPQNGNFVNNENVEKVNENAAVSVGNTANIAPMVNNPSNVITPVDINNGSMMPQNGNFVNNENVIPMMAQPIDKENNISNNLNIQEPIEIGVKDIPVVYPNEPVNLVQNNNGINQEVLSTPISTAPVASIENVNEQLVYGQTQNNTINNVVPPLVEPIIPSSVPVGTELIDTINPVNQNDLALENASVISQSVLDVNNNINPVSTMDKNEVEEIL